MRPPCNQILLSSCCDQLTNVRDKNILHKDKWYSAEIHNIFPPLSMYISNINFRCFHRYSIQIRLVTCSHGFRSTKLSTLPDYNQFLNQVISSEYNGNQLAWRYSNITLIIFIFMEACGQRQMSIERGFTFAFVGKYISICMILQYVLIKYFVSEELLTSQ